MPKLKIHQGMKKRIKITSSGKLLHRRAFGNHNFSKKSPARKRNYEREFLADKSDKPNIKKMLGI